MKYLLAVLSFALMSSPAWAVVPSNDNFAKASLITGSPAVLSAGSIAKGGTYIIASLGTTNFTALGADANLIGTVFVATGPGSGTGSVNAVVSVTGSNVGSTAETDEPVHGAVGSGNSVWWAWTATAAGTVTIDTNGSSFDTVLAVYRGSSVTGLTVLAYDDDVSSTNVTSKVSFTVTQGATYYIAVDGFKGATGSIALHLAAGPGTYSSQNDNYANRAIIGGEYAVSTGSSQTATIEPGEKNLSGIFFLSSITVNSVWWTWTAPRAGTVTISSSMLMNGGDGFGNFFGVMELYTATTDTLSGLLFLAGDQGSSGTLTTATVPTVTQTVAAGDVLQIRISDYETTNGAQITLTVSMDASDFNNDNFAKRALLTGSSASATISTNLATAQTGEPDHYEQVAADKLIDGETYMINSVGTTDFTALGAASNTLGLEFTANASGTGMGTGTALHLRPMLTANDVIITADKIEAGKVYVINTVGTTPWAAIGWTSIFFQPSSGDIFTATGPGTGTGTAYLYNSGLLILGKTYRIETLGSTDFMLLGAASNTPGITFTATNTGYGDGTVLPVDVITAGSFVIGRNYRIESVGTTDFVALGASANTVGTTFQALAVGSGTGTASTLTASKSAWWSWVAPSNGYVSISTAGSTIGTSTAQLDTLLKIYTTANLAYPTLADLVPFASNDNVDPTNATSFVHFQVVKGTSYQIAVDSGDDVRDTGNVNLGLSFIPDVPIITTQVQNQTAYVGFPPAIFTVSNTGAAAVYDWQVKEAGTNTWVHVSDGVTTGPGSGNENGVATSTLTLGSIQQAMNGDQYRCIISNVAGQVISKAGTLTTVYKALYQGGSPVTVADLGITFIDPPPATYYATGLPAGLTLNKTDGTISGRITAKPNILYTIKYWSIPAGSKIKTIQTSVLLVNSFPASMTGGFEGILLNPAIPSGKVSLVVSSTGAFTGKLYYNGKVYSLKSALTVHTLTAPVSSDVTIAVTPTVSLTITVNNNSTMTADLFAGGTNVGKVTVPEGVQLKTYPAASPAPWAGTYTLVFPAPAAPGTGPQGSGYGFVTIDYKGGLKLNGKLADGTVITASLATDGNLIGAYRPYIQLYANKLGYLGGTLQLQLRGANTGKYHITAGGGTDIWWSKEFPVANDKGSYPSGFPSVQLSALMEPWIAPTNSYLIGPLGLLTSNSQTIGNFGVTLEQTTSGVLSSAPAPLTSSLKMDAVSKVTVVDPSSLPTGFVVKITPKTGAFTGSFTLADKRKVTLQGVLLQLLAPVSTDRFGGGFFLVPPVVTKPASGSIISGDIKFNIP